MARYILDFSEGTKDMAALLGGKGANLAEMTRMGLPVPPGFTVTTEACRAYLESGTEPEELAGELADRLAALEDAAGRRLGDADDPLLLSVRSGARFSMPGMMETVLDIGLNDTTVTALARHSGDTWFAYDCYRRLLQMFGATVLGIDAQEFARVRETEHDPEAQVTAFKRLIREHSGADFPQDPAEQLRRAVHAVFGSWNGERARVYRRREHIPDDLGTAVNVQMMVFGNLGADSGSGVAFTRDPATGRPGVYGDYLPSAQGEDVVSGSHNALPVRELERLDPAAWDRLRSCLELLEDRYRDLCDVEFTVERGTLWMLQTRVGKRTPEAAFRIAGQLVDEGRVSEDEALGRLSGAALGRLMFPRFTHEGTAPVLARGVPASPGAAVGAVVFDSATAVRRAAGGEAVVLVRQETNPDDLPGMIAARAVLTSRGGKTSHAAVVARGMGRVCVCGAESLRVDEDARRFTTFDGTVVEEGTVVSVDGTAGTVHLGALPLTDSPLVRSFDAPRAAAEAGTADARTAAPDTGTGTDSGSDTDADAEALTVRSVHRLLGRADAVRRLEVRANADTPEDAALARRFGAQGIGLCRTEHMFLGERRQLVEALLTASDDNARKTALEALLPPQRADFTGILEAMDGLPVTIRLLDPPLHEFLPGRSVEQNPMLGLRGVRLGLTVPGLMALQARAIAEAVAERRRAGGDPRAEIMIPLVATVREFTLARAEVERVLAEVTASTGIDVSCPVGTMIELPRAALTAGRIAAEADFFSFGTNDLTQTTWGFSRDDAESSFLPEYLAQNVLAVSPFETVDEEGVGRLIGLAVTEGREARPGLETGVCGEHGGDPESVHVFHRLGLDYVSCSPYRVPVARLEAGRAALAGPARAEVGT
ncbi:pyruvate, phosphate dikinase [Streptomyces sp. 549]|uniref:pyruvate, phosphate dikinase n=1 Tax=Streptomyces sp. 549 TaxID=3049076 RepID=UPI0024C4095D|nr:pyruvate, phosphate dikinase [Streptomyces sp. 549]MDK1472229.1 pyruvate, phosphate dikinase [Streptomyces sp. 549]